MRTKKWIGSLAGVFLAGCVHGVPVPHMPRPGNASAMPQATFVDSSVVLGGVCGEKAEFLLRFTVRAPKDRDVYIPLSSLRLDFSPAGLAELEQDVSSSAGRVPGGFLVARGNEDEFIIHARVVARDWGILHPRLGVLTFGYMQGARMRELRVDFSAGEVFAAC